MLGFVDKKCAVEFVFRKLNLLLAVVLSTGLLLGQLTTCLAEENHESDPLGKIANASEPAKTDVASKSNSESEASDLSLDSIGNDESATDLSLDQLDSNDSDSTEQAGEASPGEALVAKPASSDWKDNLRFVIDVAVRPSYFGQTGDFSNSTFLGLDVHKVFTGDQGDIGTLTLQPFLVRVDNFQSFPNSIFDDPHDWAIDWRISNFNYTANGKGKTNFRIGSFEIPFGLEQIVNTNGTLRDYTHFQNYGLKTDWGVTLNGENNDIEYEMGVTRGSGNRYRRRGDPYLLAGRIGTSRDKQVGIGISALHGDTVNFSPLGGTTRRSRVGIDMTIGTEKYVYMSEISTGFQNDARAFTGLFEVDSFNSDESLLFYNQLVVRGLSEASSWDYELRDSFGVRWQADNSMALSVQISHFFDVLGAGNRGTTIEMQARYRF